MCRKPARRSQHYAERYAGRWFLAIAGFFLLVRLLPFLIRPGQPLGYDSGIYLQSYRFFGEALPGLRSLPDGSFHQLEANALRFLSDFLLLSGLNPDDLVFALLLAVQLFLLCAVWLFARRFFDLQTTLELMPLTLLLGVFGAALYFLRGPSGGRLRLPLILFAVTALIVLAEFIFHRRFAINLDLVMVLFAGVAVVGFLRVAWRQRLLRAVLAVALIGAAAALLGLSAILAAIGMLADMLDRQRFNQEELIAYARKAYYDAERRDALSTPGLRPRRWG